MKTEAVLFSDLLIETRDGEWGEGQENPGHILCDVIRGTDFSDLHSPQIQLPQRWIPEHLVDRKALAPGDIVLETAGGTAKQSTGRTALITPTFMASRNGRPVLCASFARHLRVDRTKVHPIYLYYMLQGLYASGYMAVFNLQHTGVARFQFTAFRTKTQLNLHRDKAQENIAAILSAYDDQIANNQRRIALLEFIAEDIYREWFVRMRFPGYESSTFIHGLPKGWTQKLVSEVADVNSRSLRKGSETGLIRYVDIGAVGTNELRDPAEIQLGDAPGRARRLVSHGDVLWSSVRPGNKAYCVVIDPPPNLVASTGFAVISPKTGTPYSYLHKAVTTQNFTDQMVTVAKGSAYPATSFDDFARARIIWPNSTLLDEFHSKLRPMYEEVDALRKLNRRLRETRDALLPRLISGKLRVDHLDIQAPPSMRAETAQAA
jgi:type I restriction enzyme, S subunit